jgi:hypothetical protein
MIAAVLFAAAVALPKVDIVYPPHGTIYDRNCSNAAQADVDAAIKLRPELEAEWTREGPQYLNAAFEAVGKPFPYGEMQAYLTVCPSAGTMSAPLMVNVRQYLAGAAHPAPAGDFSEKLFHELMHHYVSSIGINTPLRKKYSAEPMIVQAHLHVIALEKLVLTKLGKTAELKFLEQEYVTSPKDSYARAWQIVNEEGYEKFIDELRAKR